MSYPRLAVRLAVVVVLVLVRAVAGSADELPAAYGAGIERLRAAPDPVERAWGARALSGTAG